MLLCLMMRLANFVPSPFAVTLADAGVLACFADVLPTVMVAPAGAFAFLALVYS